MYNHVGMPFHRPIPDRNPRGKATGVMDAVIQAEKMIQIALILPCAAFIGWLGGAWLGSRLHQPWLGLVGIVFGGVSGLYYVVRLAMSAVNEPVRKAPSGNSDASPGNSPRPSGDANRDGGTGPGNARR